MNKQQLRAHFAAHMDGRGCLAVNVVGGAAGRLHMRMRIGLDSLMYQIKAAWARAHVSQHACNFKLLSFCFNLAFASTTKLS